ncbi:MAG TPA: Ig-like domain-containing protein [Termitinemataceae bacterium]|nr:Ig-like domain-containing protein [Termitinemataceae bacterium]
MNTMRQPSQNPHKKIYWWGVLGISLIGVMVPLSCELFNVGLGNKVDLYPPEVRITSPVNNAYVNYTDNKIVISGTVTDDGAVPSVVLYWENGAKSKKAVISGNDWSVTFNEGELADGRYVFTARATDASNKSGEWQSTVNVDTTPPSGSFIFTADRGTSQDNPYNGKEKIQGMAEDGSGRLSSVVVTLGGVRIFPTDTNPTPDASEMASWNAQIDFDEVVTGLNDSNSKWKGAAFTKVTGTGSVYTANLRLVVTDQAGNSAEVTQTCYVDLTYDAPRITWPASMDVSTDANYPRDPTQYSGNIFKNGDTIDITVEDDDAVDRGSAKLVLETGSGTKHEFTVANNGLVVNPSGTTKATSVRFRFTVPQETQLPQGEYEFSFEVSDDATYKNGKGPATFKVEKKSLVIDNGPPTLTVNPLASNVLRSDAFTLSGTASDGWDINSVQISLDGGVSWQNANLSGSAGSYTWSWNGISTPEGYYNIQVRSVDKGGSKSSRDLQVTIDNTAPDLSFNQVFPIVESSGKKVNGIIKASVTAADSNGLMGVRYWTYTSTPPNETSQDWNGTGYTELTSAPYGVTIDTEALSGTLYLRFGALDKAGNIKYITYEPLVIDQSTDKPTITITNLNQSVSTWDGAAINLLESNARIIGLLSDDDGIDASSVQIRYTDRLNSSTDPLVWGDWQNETSASSTSFDYTFPSDISEGVLAVEVRVSDKVSLKEGKPAVSTTIGPFYITIDRQPPSLSTITIDGNAFGETPVFRTTDFTLAGTVSDTNGVASVSITQTKEGNSSTDIPVTLGTGTTSRTWTASISLSGEGSYTYTITATDVVGHRTTVTRTVIVDTQAPSAPTVTSPALNTWILGSSYTVSGSASDVGSAGIGAVYYVAGPAMGYTPPADLASWSKANGTDSWSGTINLTDLGEGPKKLYVKAVDKAGNVSTQTEVPFGIDQSAPTISLTGPGNDLVNGTITFTGTASDSYLVALITVAEKKPGDTGFTDIGTATYDSGTGTWSYARPITGLSDGFYEYRITVTDGALKIATVTKTITIDTTGPAISFNQPAPYIEKSGTVYGNGTMTMSGTASDLNGLAGLEYRIAGGTWQSVGSAPYTNFTFTVDTTAYTDDSDLLIEVRGTDKAGNVAVASYTLRVDQDTDKPTWTITSPTEGGLVASQTITISGTLSDDDGLNDTTLYYRLSADGGTTWSPDWTQISSSYLSGSATAKTLSSFSFTNSIDGAKILQLKIADVNGTVATKSITFTQDAGAPTISNISPATTGYRNGDFTVSGTATDSQGTVAAVRYRVVKDGATVVVNWTNCTLGSPGSATTTFTTGTIPTSSGTGIYQVTFETEDNAGNKRQESYAYTVDKTLPTGSFASPASGSTTNNIITLSGTASDNFGLNSLRLAIMKGGTEVADLGAPTGANNWSLSFDTRTYDESAYATLISGSLYEITLRLIITDVAGNIATVDRTFRIDQSTDIPQISFTTQQGVYLSDSKIYGTATDDDGIASIEVSTNGGASWTTLSAPSGGWGTSASWNYDLGSTDGTYTLRVRVTDISSPAIVGTSSDANFLVDREAPEGAFTAPAANSKLKASDLTFTGTYGDENPVASVQLKIDSSDFTSGAVTATMSGGSGSTSGTWSYTFATIPDGTRTIYARITDAAGRTTLISRTVVVDTTGPVVTIIDPADLTSVYGKVTIRGSAEDATTTVKNIKIGIGKTVNEADYEGSPWYPATGTVSWSYTFNNINAYANTTYAVDIGDTNQNGVQDAGETWMNIWRMKIYIRAEDTAGLGSTGNIAYVSTYTLEIDPNGDRPEVTVLDPDDGATIGGYKRIFGIAQDGQSIWKVQIAFDMNNDGDFNDAGDVWPSISGFTPPSADESDSSTTAWYLVNGTTSWYQTINLYGEFNPTGTDTTRTIKFKVRAWDYKTTPGDGIPGIEVVRTITFDKTVPQYADISHETGSTVGGSFTITGYVRDESGLQSIIFKHEGPRISSQELIGASSGQPRAMLVNSGEPGYVAGYQTYRLEIPIDTTEAGLFPASSGIMAVALDAIDSSGFHSILSLSFNVDNIQPSNLTHTGGTEIIGTQAEVQGTVQDTGIVSGIKQVVVYLQRGSSVLRLKGGSGSLDVSGVLNLNDSTYDDYRIVIDNRLEDGNDSGSAGDNDGFAEWLTISGGVYNWAARFNSTLVSDGKTEVHYVAYDFAGNMVSGSTNAYVANNKPSITSIVLGTDLNGDGDVDDSGEKRAPISSGYSATNFTARGNRLYIEVNTVGGNGTKRYSVKYKSKEQNGTLTSNTITIDTSSFSESTVANDQTLEVLVFDSTTLDDEDATDELSAAITLGLTIDNVDTVAPTTWLYQLTATDVKDYDPSNRFAWKGHIEPWDQSPYDNYDSGFDKTNEVFGNDADVSGTVVFRGGASDNQRLSALSLWIDLNGDGDEDDGETKEVAHFDAASQALIPTTNTLGSWESVSQSLTLDGGHTVEWTFEWDSSTVNGVARANVRIRVRAEDARPAASGGPNGSVQTPATPTDSTALTAGFNIMKVDVVPYVTKVTTRLSQLKTNNPSVYDRTALGHYPVRTAESITLSGFNVSGADVTGITGESSTATTVTVPMTSANSGLLSLTVNSVPLINNSNNNGLPINQWPNGDNNNALTDDIILDVWQFNSQAAIPSRGLVTDPVMRINPTNGIIGFAFVNGPDYFSMSNGTTNSYTLWQRNYDDFYHVAMVYDTNGWSHAVVVGRDINSGSNHGGRFVYLTSRWGISEINTQNGNYGGDQAIRLESIGVPAGTVINGTSTPTAILDKSRIRSPSIAVAGTTTNRVYLAYYDDINQQIRFRYGNNSYGSKAAAGGDNGGFNQFIDQRDVNNNAITSNVVFESHATNYSIVADVYNVTPNKPGEYLALGVIPGANAAGDVVVLVWFDYVNQKLMFTYKVAPQNDNNASNTHGNGYWSAPIEIFNGAGEYCNLAIDSAGGIHIVGYDTTNADLKYAYLSSYTDTVPDTCVVDSYGIVGTNITIDVAKDASGNVIPYIGYYNISTQMPKLAYLVDTSSKAPNGMENDVFTGKWEITLLPTASKVPADRINVGVWKDTNGVIKASTTGTSSANTTSGTAYGNGTSNPVLAYAIKNGTNGYLETAQKK